MPAPVVSLLLALWAGTALVFPMLRRAVTSFVDDAVLGRQDYGQLVADLGPALQRLDTVTADWITPPPFWLTR